MPKKKEFERQSKEVGFELHQIAEISAEKVKMQWKIWTMEDNEKQERDSVEKKDSQKND